MKRRDFITLLGGSAAAAALPLAAGAQQAKLRTIGFIGASAGALPRIVIHFLPTRTYQDFDAAFARLHEL